jgi:hypothetical protein
MKASQIRILDVLTPDISPRFYFEMGLVRPKCFVLFENFVTFCDLLQASDLFLVRLLFLSC